MVSLDGHTFEVITADLVPVVPYYAQWIFLGIGQRADVIFEADQPVGNYWFRAESQDQVGCGRNLNNGNIKSIFRYKGAPDANPNSAAVSYTQSCANEKTVPYWDSFVPAEPVVNGGELDTAITIGVQADGSAIVQWGINKSAMNVMWNEPVLEYVLQGNDNFSKSQNLISLPTADMVCPTSQ